MAPIIHFEGVGKRYALRHNQPRSFQELFVRRLARQSAAGGESLWALRDVSFAIGRGETVGLIGANGAGKSTALKLISRVIVPTTGRLAVNGRVAALLELGTGFHPDLSGRDNVYLSGALAGMSRAEIERKFDDVIAFSELAPFIDMPVKHYSSGMFARLAFAVSIHLDPQVLLVDEVLAVGDHAFQQKCLDRIADLQRTGVTICLVSHSAEVVRKLCTRAIWFDHGQVQADGPAEAVVRQYLDAHLEREAERLAAGQGPSDNQRWGSRRVEIVRVRLLDGQGRERALFETGESLTIELEYQAREPVRQAVFGMALHRQDGLHLAGPNTGFAGLPLPVLDGRGTVTYAIPYLPFLEGLYHVSVSAHDQADTEMFDFHDRAYPFRIVNRGEAVRERYGLLTLRGEWQHRPLASVAAPVAATPERR